MMGDYAGNDVSKLGMALLYMYEHLMLMGVDKGLSDELLRISENEMSNFRTLGDIILQLGGDPQFRGEDGRFFDASSIVYPGNIREMLMVNIQIETASIQNYTQRWRMAPTQSIAEAYERMIEDARRNLAFFREQLNLIIR